MCFTYDKIKKRGTTMNLKQNIFEKITKSGTAI